MSIQTTIKNMKVFTISCLLLIGSGCGGGVLNSNDEVKQEVASPTNTLTGKIIDFNTRQAIVDASLTLIVDGESRSIASVDNSNTQQAGYFKFDNLPSGTHILKIESDNMATVEYLVNVQSSQDNTPVSTNLGIISMSRAFSVKAKVTLDEIPLDGVTVFARQEGMSDQCQGVTTGGQNQNPFSWLTSSIHEVNATTSANGEVEIVGLNQCLKYSLVATSYNYTSTESQKHLTTSKMVNSLSIDDNVILLSMNSNDLIQSSFGNVTGKLVDFETRKPIVGAELSLFVNGKVERTQSISEQSDEKTGKFSFDNVPGGNYKLRIEYPEKATIEYQVGIHGLSVNNDVVTDLGEIPLVNKFDATVVVSSGGKYVKDIVIVAQALQPASHCNLNANSFYDTNNSLSWANNSVLEFRNVSNEKGKAVLEGLNQCIQYNIVALAKDVNDDGISEYLIANKNISFLDSNEPIKISLRNVDNANQIDLDSQNLALKLAESFSGSAIADYSGWQSPINWVLDNSQVYDGSQSAKSGLVNDSESSDLVMKIDLSTSGYISFWRKVSTEFGFDYFRFYIDGVEQQKWSGEKDWQQQIYFLSKGQRTLKWEYSKDESEIEGMDAAWIDLIEIWERKPIDIDFELGDFSEESFTFSNNGSWVIESEGANGSSYSAKSPLLPKGESSYMEITVSAQESVSFSFKKGIDSCCARFRFFVNGFEKESWFGINDWQSYSTNLSGTGDHTLRWEIRNESFSSSDQNSIWIDNIVVY